MPIVGEKVFTAKAWDQGDGIYTASWEYNMSPTHTLAKTFISEYSSFESKSAGLAYISRIRRRRPDGADTDERFPDSYTSNSSIHMFSDKSLTNVTFSIQVRKSKCTIMMIIEFWSE